MSLTGTQKLAAFLLSLDTETASTILTRFTEAEIGDLCREMIGLRTLDRETVEEVQREFMEMMENSEGFIPNTRSVAEQLLRLAVGDEKQMEMLGYQEDGRIRSRPFEVLAGVDARQLAEVLKAEHPQIVALVLSYLKPQQAGQVLSRLPEEIHSDVVVRMTRLEKTSVELLSRLDHVISAKVQSAEPKVGGINEETKNKKVAEILNLVGKTVRKSALETIANEEPDRAREIENLMFVFEDFLNVDDASVRKVLMEVDNDTLALALKTASEELREKFFHNVSKRAAESINETLESFGPKPLSEVEAAQHEIMRTAHALDEQGQIVLRRTEEEQLV